MKKILMIFAVSTVLFSCSKDDKDNTQPTNNNPSSLQAILPGEWKMTHTHQEGKNTVSGQVLNTFVTDGSNFKGTALFEENPNKVTSDFGYDYTTVLTISLGGSTQTQTITDVIPQTSTVSSWSINSQGQLVGLSSDPQATATPLDVTIKSATEIVLKGTSTTTQTQQGTTMTSEIDVEITLEKLP
ncbi:MAG: hypothetical protein ACPF9D_05590 [Owenweeksia sp.]